MHLGMVEEGRECRQVSGTVLYYVLDTFSSSPSGVAPPCLLSPRYLPLHLKRLWVSAMESGSGGGFLLMLWLKDKIPLIFQEISID